MWKTGMYGVKLAKWVLEETLNLFEDLNRPLHTGD